MSRGKYIPPERIGFTRVHRWTIDLTFEGDLVVAFHGDRSERFAMTLAEAQSLVDDLSEALRVSRLGPSN